IVPRLRRFGIRADPVNHYALLAILIRELVYALKLRAREWQPVCAEREHNDLAAQALGRDGLPVNRAQRKFDSLWGVCCLSRNKSGRRERKHKEKRRGSHSLATS